MPLPSLTHPERHLSGRSNWLRAAVLGANDGLVSVSSLLLGVVAGGASHQATILAGFAGLAAGALSMAAGEYVSVSSQRDAENADLALEGRELRADPAGELEELAGIYERRGLPSDLAHRVAEALTEQDALGAHARDELGMHEATAARPLQAALSSAAAFAAGAVVPALAAAFVPARLLVPVVVAATLLLLVGLGGLAARVGGASVVTGSVRVTFWGALAMAVTAAAGALFGAVG